MQGIDRPIIILGHKGMLGQMALDYFSKKGAKIHTVNSRFDAESKWDFMDEILKVPNAIILNCIGKIKQKTSDDQVLLTANAILPLTLASYLPSSYLLVHPSTDCVFDGKKGEAYAMEDSADARDDYGWSKRLGETALEGRSNTIILRVSIIGPDHSAQAKGLLGWFLSNASGAQLKGFSNHLWNGITTLEWCKLIERLIMEEKWSDERAVMYQGGTEESYSKEEMLQLFQKYYQTDYSITGFETEEAIDRRLVPNLVSKSLEEQLEELVKKD